MGLLLLLSVQSNVTFKVDILSFDNTNVKKQQHVALPIISPCRLSNQHRRQLQHCQCITVLSTTTFMPFCRQRLWSPNASHRRGFISHFSVSFAVALRLNVSLIWRQMTISKRTGLGSDAAAGFQPASEDAICSYRRTVECRLLLASRSRVDNTRISLRLGDGRRKIARRMQSFVAMIGTDRWAKKTYSSICSVKS